MEFVPMDRNTMRGLKEKKDEEARIEKVKFRVSQIYHLAVRQAQTTTNTTYSLDIDTQQNQYNSEYQFYKDNMEEILSGLQRLFPDCSVKLVKMCVGYDGKRYDISTIDEKMLPFMNHKQAFECIVVDWS